VPTLTLSIVERSIAASGYAAVRVFVCLCQSPDDRNISVVFITVLYKHS